MLEVTLSEPLPHTNPRRLLEKATELLYSGNVSRINSWTFIVEGYTGFHMVKEQPNGMLVCECKGFMIHAVCSHVLAVATIIEKGRT